VKIGVLAVQGNFREHAAMGRRLGKPVLIREGRVASFHPELTDDERVHERFLALVREEAGVRA
jgi:glutamine amidotransferase PdxT